MEKNGIVITCLKPDHPSLDIPLSLFIQDKIPSFVFKLDNLIILKVG